MKASDFHERGGGGVYLRRDAMKRYLAAWEEHLTRPLAGGHGTDLRRSFRRQAERLAAALMGGPAYCAFSLERP